MKLFERVIEQRLRSYLEDIGFIDKYQSGFRQNKSTDDHFFRVSQSVMESFNTAEHAVAAFLDVEKAFENAWHNGLTGGVSPISHDALNQIIYMIFPPFCQVIHVLFLSVEGEGHNSDLFGLYLSRDSKICRVSS